MRSDYPTSSVNPVPRANACGFGSLPFGIIAPSPRTDVWGFRGTG